MLGEMAWAEVENKSERQRRANRQAAEKGKPWMTGPRPFGYERAGGMLVPHEKEASALRDAFAMLTSGSSLYSVTKMLNDSGFTSTLGNEWRHNNVRVMLLNPLYAGLRAYAEMPPLGSNRSARSRPNYEDRTLVAGNWEALISEDVWRASVSILRDPGRKTNVGNLSSVRWLGSNLYGCLRCEGEQGTEADLKRTGVPFMAVNWTNPRRDGQRGRRIYKCKRCFMTRRADPVDGLVEDMIAERLNRQDGADVPPTDSSGRADLDVLRREAGEVRARLDVLADSLADGEMTKDQFARANRRASDRLAAIEAELAEAGRTDVLAGLRGPGAGQRWLTSDDIRWRRAVLAAVADVLLSPAKTGRPKKGEVMDPTSVIFRWRTS
ncbi:recombinase family protein [Micromonospora kangleipakensis]